MNKDITIGWIGLGKLGLACAEVFAEHYVTLGYDTNYVPSDSVRILDTVKETIELSDWIFIAVPTPHREEYGGGVPSSHLIPKDFDYAIVKDVLRDINMYATAEKNIVLVSTVLPGTIREEFDDMLDNHTLIYNPYLIAMGSTKWDMVNPEMLIIGSKDVDDPRVDELIDIYHPMMENNPRAECGTWEEAEGIKIFYNTFISAKIGLVNMIQDFSMRIGHMNADVIASALARSSQRIMGPAYMVPGMGDSGACHPRDNIALRSLGEKYGMKYDMFDTIMFAREKQAESLAEFLIDQSDKYNLPIVIHGKAYKPDVPYEIGSYSTLIGHYILRAAKTVHYADPLTGDDLEPMKAVVLLAHNREVTYGYMGDIKADTFYFEILPGSIIVDPWRKTNKNLKDYTVIHYGDTR